MKRYESIQRAMATTIWACTPEHLEFLTGLVTERIMHGTPDDSVIAARLEGKSYGSQPHKTQKSVAVLPLHGTIAPRMDLMTQLSGGTSSEGFAHDLRALADDNDVSSIVIDVDSPGGAVSNIDSAVEAMRYATARKRVTAYTSGNMASAAYWIASQAHEIKASPNAVVGSIGVIATHFDKSQAAADEGVKVTYLRSGDNKALGQPFESLDENAVTSIMDQLRTHHQLFVSDVAIGRGRQPTDVQAQWGDGRVFIGRDALDVGLIDSVGTLDDAISQAQERTLMDAQEQQKLVTAERDAVMAKVGSILGLDTCNTATLTEYAEMRSQLESEAEDGRAYRAALLDDIAALNIATGENEATAERMRTVFATQDIKTLEQEVTRLNTKRDGMYPNGRVSEPSKQGAKPNKRIHDWEA